MLKKEHSVWLASGFGAWMETALNVPAELESFAPEAIYILLDDHFARARAWTQAEVASATASLRRAFPRVPVVVPDIAKMAADFGEDFYSEKMWRLSSMPFSLAGLRELQKLFTLKKVLCLDLDNTLWAGVIGEDGVDGIVPNAEFQARVKALQARGVVLAALSRNHPEDVEGVWQDARMLLKREDFVALAIDWRDKAENIARVAAELNLGLESFVFVDDNPAERMQMRARRPEVCTAAFPPALDVYFPERPLTAEDAARTLQYQAEAERRQAAAAGLSAEEYLQGLQLRTEIHPVRDDEIPRVAQLSQKTNQFNVCTNRYSEDDVRRFAGGPSHVLMTMHAADRFGDQGLVAFVLVSLNAETAPASARILDWVMSCRAMNRRLEFKLQQALEDHLRSLKVERLFAAWRATAKNAPVESLFDAFGFTLVAATVNERSYVKNIL